MNITSYTNFSSKIVQNNLSKSTNALNTAIERMTTGFKINGAKDNAANYSISETMSSKISSYQVAEDNAMTGVDMVQTAQSAVEQLSDRTARLRELAIQAQNGTYGEASIKAMNDEAQAIISEINRIQSNTQYNGINLLKVEDSEETKLKNLKTKIAQFNFANPSAAGANSVSDVSGASDVSGVSGVSGASATSDYYTRTTASPSDIMNASFSTEIIQSGNDIMSADFKLYDKFIINNISSPSGIENLTNVAELDSFVSGERYKVSTKEDLIKLAELVNANESTANVRFVMDADIDLSSVENWTTIGSTYSLNGFQGTFDGNGHVIKNLKQTSGDDYAGLFGKISGNAQIINLGLEDVNIDITENNHYSGSLVALADGGNVQNCWATGYIRGATTVGGLVGEANCNITDSYTDMKVVSDYGPVGGIAGQNAKNILNCYSSSDVSGWVDTGGISGTCIGAILNCYATGDVEGHSYVGGIVGNIAHGSVQIVWNTFSTGNVSGEDYVGGIAGYIEQGGIVRSVSFCDVSATGDYVGGIVGRQDNSTAINNSGSFSKINANAEHVGVLFGSGSSYYPLFYNSEINPDMNITGSGTVDCVYNIPTTKFFDKIEPLSFSLQVGINGENSSAINFSISTLSDSMSKIAKHGISNSESIGILDSYLDQLSAAATSLGAVQNRLMSSLESISVAYENLVSSRSTLRDADMAQVSSSFIKNQILQQASATLLATANQAPSIALQLL